MCTENALKTKCKAIVHSRIPYPIHEKPNGVFLFSFWFFVLSFLFLHVSISESLFISTESAVIVCVSHFETIHNGFENQVDMQATKFFFFLSFHFVLILLLGCSCCCFCSPLPSFVRIAFWCDFIYVFILSFRVRFFSTLFWVCNARTTFEPHSRSVNLSSQSHCNASTVEILHMNHTIKWTDRLCI